MPLLIPIPFQESLRHPATSGVSGSGSSCGGFCSVSGDKCWFVLVGSCHRAVSGHWDCSLLHFKRKCKINFPFRQFGRLETSVQCLSVGASNSRERLQDSVQVSPSEFSGMLLTTVKPDQGLFLVQELESLLAKKAIDSGPLPERDSGFYSHYFLVPKKDKGLHPILELRLLNLSPQSFTKCMDAALAALWL